jgi:hypothetical protein
MKLLKHFESYFLRRPWRLTAVILLLVIGGVLSLLPVVNRIMTTPSEKWATLLAVGQFFSGLLLIPVAIFGFEFARRSFEESQAKPILDLAICNPQDSASLEKQVTLEAKMNSSDYVGFSVNIYIKNTGSAIADLYMIEMSNLKQLNLAGDQSISELNEQTPNPPSGWKNEIEIKDKLTFIGRNNHPAFPNQNTPLCELTVNIKRDACEPTLYLHYKIYVGSEPPVEDKLKVDLIMPVPLSSASYQSVAKGRP